MRSAPNGDRDEGVHELVALADLPGVHGLVLPYPLRMMVGVLPKGRRSPRRRLLRDRQTDPRYDELSARVLRRTDRASGTSLGPRHKPTDVPHRDDHAGLTDELTLQPRERTADDQESFTG